MKKNIFYSVLFVSTFVLSSSVYARPSFSNLQKEVDELKSQIIPTWSQTLASDDGDLFCLDGSCSGSSSRFLSVFNRLAVLDRETGLVWEVRPKPLFENDDQPPIKIIGWGGAHSICRSRIIGGRMGWRLPSIEELSSLLVAPSFSNNFEPIPGVTLPKTSFGGLDVFGAGVGETFWTSTSFEEDDAKAYTVTIDDGTVQNSGHGSISTRAKSQENRWWCVRGSGY